MKNLISLFISTLLFLNVNQAQSIRAISDSFRPLLKVPELLVSNNGTTIKTKKQWNTIRRPEIVSLLEQEEYGKIPGEITISSVKITDEDRNALDGKAIRKQVVLIFEKNGKSVSFELLMYLPKGKKSYPTFLSYNFGGNQSIYSDTNIHYSKPWNGQPANRGSNAANWPVEKIIQSGCGVVTLNNWDIALDRNDFSIGIYTLLYKDQQTLPALDEWGSLAAWAWGLSRALDYLKTDKDVDGNKVIALGHSRLGKASLWAGAHDQRFAGVISSGSGCGGASMHIGKVGEKIANINKRFPQWTCGNFKKYSNKEDSLPFDQHFVLALVAPRPIYVASATADAWADPHNEYLSAYYASSVYQLYGIKGIQHPEVPKFEAPITGVVSHHIRIGKHDILEYDWNNFIQFAKENIK